jgi:FkbM family methyltransferase
VSKFFKKIAKIPLDLLAAGLRRSPSALYYLVKEALPNEIRDTESRAFAHQHIENASFLGKNILKNASDTGGGYVIADVGGGTATTATMFAQLFPNLPIYVFEPIKENFNTIDHSPHKTANWRTRNQAVGSSVGESYINVASRVTASSLLEMDDQIEGYGSMLQLQKREKIDITTLDHSIAPTEKVLILKLDVQGFELEVLRGGAQTLARTSVIVLEINNHEGYKNAPTYYEIDEFLRQAGFQLHDLLPSARVNGKLQDWDAIYVKN